jgi:GNAT superfamily N-acetyltransferase
MFECGCRSRRGVAWSGPLATGRPSCRGPVSRAWLPRVRDEIIGLVELELEHTGDVGIVVFGLVPEFIGSRFGGALLTATVQLAWNMSSEPPVRRVWVQTSSGDHPNAIANYRSRGFVMFQTQPKQAHGSRSLACASVRECHPSGGARTAQRFPPWASDRVRR